MFAVEPHIAQAQSTRIGQVIPRILHGIRLVPRFWCQHAAIFVLAAAIPGGIIERPAMHLFRIMPLSLATCLLTAATWNFRTDVDLSQASAIDLSHLNEDVAGQHGFVRRSADGESFLRGDGADLRFWCVGPYYKTDTSDEDLRRHAQFLARMGVNLVRPGGAESGLIPQTPGAPLDQASPEFLDKIWRLVAAMREEGIYTRIAPFWDHGAVKHVDPEWGIEGYGTGDRLNGVLFIDPTLQAAFREWMRQLLVEPNPYTGIPLRDDPSVAIIQIVSEDTLLFYWLDKIHGGPRRLLEERFAAWASERHGSVPTALDIWQRNMQADAPDAGRLGILPLYEIAKLESSERADDTLQFLAELERQFYVDTIRYLREDLGVEQLITTSNFMGGGEEVIGDALRWIWSAGDIIELNDFFNCQHKGKQAAWKVQAGHRYLPRSSTRVRELPPAMKQVAGLPMINSSTNWLPPNPYAVEGPVMHALYSAQNGIDGVCWLGSTSPTYNDRLHMPWSKVEGSHPMFKWRIDDPKHMAQFPASALIYRQGLIPEAAPALIEKRSLVSIFNREQPRITGGLSRATEAITPWQYDGPTTQQQSVGDGVRDQDLHLFGPVQLAFADSNDLQGQADPASDTRFASEHLTLDREQGLLLVDAPQVQGVVGFLQEAGGDFQMSQVTINARNAFGSVLAVSMDGQPLSVSRKILIQCGAIVRPTGWQEEIQDDGMHRITDTGRMPWQVAATEASIRIDNAQLRTLQLLDEHGVAQKQQAIEPGASIPLPSNCLYALLTD